MITYEPFWNTLKQKGLTQYALINDYDVSTSLLNRLRKNRHISTYTIDRLCQLLHCQISDIVKYVDETTKNTSEQ